MYKTTFHERVLIMPLFETRAIFFLNGMLVKKKIKLFIITDVQYVFGAFVIKGFSVVT